MGFPPAYVLGNCTEPSHCGTFIRTTSRCDCVPTYRMNATQTDAVRVLYRGSNPDGSSYWVVGTGARADDCGLTATDYTLGLTSTIGSNLQASTLFYLMSGDSPHSTTPDMDSYAWWQEVSAVSGIAPAPPDFAVTASNGRELCLGVQCGGGGECAYGSCECTGLFVGSRCEDECACSSRGQQTGLEIARDTGRCADGSCMCDAGSTGLFCEEEDSGR